MPTPALVGDPDVEWLIAVYRRAEADLQRELSRLVGIAADDTRRFRRRQVDALLSRVAAVRARLDDATEAWVRDNLARIYARGVAAGSIVGEAGSSETFTLIHRQALDVLARDTFGDLAAATQRMEEQARRDLRRLARLVVGEQATAGAGVPEAVADLVELLRGSGVRTFVDRGGRTWNLATYAEMVIRTKSAQAYNTATVLQAHQEGTAVFEIRDGERSGHEPCASKSGSTCTAAWALAHPIEHPNAVMPGTRVLPIGRVTAAYRIPWSGPVVRVRTARAGWLTVGPYHPVLTSRGWIAAHLIEEGDQVVRRTVEMVDPASLRDLDDVPPRIEEVFDALCEVGMVSRVAAAVDKFHGDGRFAHGYVDVVTTDRPLSCVGDVAVVEERGERIFDHDTAAVVSHAPSRVSAASLRIRAVALAAASRQSRGDVRGVGVAAADVDTLLAQPLADDAVADAEGVADLSRRLTAPVALDDVVEVEFTSWTGHLFDLSTEGRAYFADERIVSNCVRSFGPLPIHDGPIDFALPPARAGELAGLGVDPARFDLRDPV